MAAWASQELTDSPSAAACASTRVFRASDSRRVTRAVPASSAALSAAGPGASSAPCWAGTAVTTNSGSPALSLTSITTSSSLVVISAAAAESTSSRVSLTDESSASASRSATRATSSEANRVSEPSSRRNPSVYGDKSMTSL